MIEYLMKVQLDLKKLSINVVKNAYLVVILVVFGFVMTNMIIGGVAELLLHAVKALANLFVQVCGQGQAS